MAFDFSRIKNKTPEKKPTEEKIQNKGIDLIYSNDTVYDLDEMIATKRRKSSEVELVVRVATTEEITDRLIELVTKELLDQYEVEYTEDNYKTQVQYIMSFELLFDRLFAIRYESFIAMEELDASISADTILRKLPVRRTDMLKVDEKKRLELENISLKRQLNNAVAENNADENMVSSFNATITSLNDELEDSKTELSNLTKEYSQLEVTYNTTKDELSNMFTEYTEYKNEMQPKYDALELENNSNIEKIEVLTSEYNNLSNTYDELKEENKTTIEVTIPKYEEQIEDLNSQLTVAERTNAELVTEKISLKQDIVSLNTTVESLNSEITTLETKVSELETYVNDKEDEINNLGNEILELNSTVETLNVELQRYIDKYGELEDETIPEVVFIRFYDYLGVPYDGMVIEYPYGETLTRHPEAVDMEVPEGYIGYAWATEVNGSTLVDFNEIKKDIDAYLLIRERTEDDDIVEELIPEEDVEDLEEDIEDNIEDNMEENVEDVTEEEIENVIEDIIEE